MKLLESLFKPKFVDKVANEIADQAKKYPTEPRLQEFAVLLAKFVQDYGAKTPTYLGGIFTALMSNLDPLDIAGTKRNLRNLIVAGYLAILEMQGLEPTDEDLKTIKELAEQLVKNGPKIVTKFREFSEAQKTGVEKTEKADLGGKAKRRFKIIGGFAKDKLSGIKKSGDPLVQKSLAMLAAHGFFKTDEQGDYVFESLIDQVALLYFMLENKFKLSDAMNRLAPVPAIDSEEQAEVARKEVGQIYDIFYLLKDAGWPAVLNRTYMRSFVNLINQGCEQLLQGDVRLLRNIVFTFKRQRGEPNLISATSNVQLQVSIGNFMANFLQEDQKSKYDFNGANAMQLYAAILKLPTRNVVDTNFRIYLLTLFKLKLEEALTTAIDYMVPVTNALQDMFALLPPNHAHENAELKTAMLTMALEVFKGFCSHRGHRGVVYNIDAMSFNPAENAKRKGDLVDLVRNNYDFYAQMLTSEDKSNVAFLRYLQGCGVMRGVDTTLLKSTSTSKDKDSDRNLPTSENQDAESRVDHVPRPSTKI